MFQELVKVDNIFVYVLLMPQINMFIHKVGAEAKVVLRHRGRGFLKTGKRG